MALLEVVYSFCYLYWPSVIVGRSSVTGEAVIYSIQYLCSLRHVFASNPG